MDGEKQQIKQYWNDKQPNSWYGESIEEIEQKKYNCFYPYIPKIADFQNYKGKKVLEIGTGLGLDLKQYAQNGADCYGIDLTEGTINKTRETLGHFNLKADLQVMDAEELKFEDNTFDLVYSFGVLHHIPHTQVAIDEIYRVLKPNGKAIIMLYSKSWQHYVLRVGYWGILRGMIKQLGGIQELTNYFSEAYGNCPLTKLYHKKDLKIMFDKFKDIEIKHYHYKNNFFQTIRGYYMGNWIIKALK